MSRSTTLTCLQAILLLTHVAGAAKPKHIVMLVADDLGRNDLGIRNANAHGPRTSSPNIDGLISAGVTLSSYHTFKICGPSRGSSLTGRYPWGMGFYDMNEDNLHTTTNFTLYPELLQRAGYATHALGKWDVGWMVRNATATYRGFDDFYGYYLACNSDYWYHTVANGAARCTPGNAYNASVQDWSDNAGAALGPGDRLARNGTYNAELLTARAEALIRAHNASQPLYLYLAYQNVHEGCARPDKLGMQAPLGAVAAYNTTELDTYKLMGAMISELDAGVGRVVAALRAAGLFDDALIAFVSDNGGPLEHATNAPLRGGKHTFFDGGLRVEAFLSGGAVPPNLRGTTWDGLAHASDWYLTLLQVRKEPGRGGRTGGRGRTMRAVYRGGEAGSRGGGGCPGGK
jgi:arylsulfatase A-like enzyme